MSDYLPFVRGRARFSRSLPYRGKQQARALANAAAVAEIDRLGGASVLPDPDRPGLILMFAWDGQAWALLRSWPAAAGWAQAWQASPGAGAPSQVPFEVSVLVGDGGRAAVHEWCSFVNADGEHDERGVFAVEAAAPPDGHGRTLSLLLSLLGPEGRDAQVSHRLLRADKPA